MHICINATSRTSWAKLPTGTRITIGWNYAGSEFSRRARTGRNPRTGDNVRVTEKHMPAFRTGKEVRELLNRY